MACVNKWPLVAGLCPSLSNDVFLRLKSKGIETVMDFISHNPERITAKCGLPFKKVLAIRRVLLAQYSSFPVNGLNLYKETLNTIAVLPTGCSTLDQLLDCGVYTGEVTEIVGVSASGKTQFCHSFSVNVAATLAQNVIYIDSTAGASVRRMAEIFKLNHSGKPITSALSRIKICQCQSLVELRHALQEIKKQLQFMETFSSALKVIVIDSISSILGACTYASSYVEGMSEIQSVGRELNKFAKDFAIAIVVVNDMVSSGVGTTSTASIATFPMKPALGRCWAYVPSVRLLFELAQEPVTISRYDLIPQHEPCVDINATVLKSPRSLCRSFPLSLSRCGVVECKD